MNVSDVNLPRSKALTLWQWEVEISDTRRGSLTFFNFWTERYGCEIRIHETCCLCQRRRKSLQTWALVNGCLDYCAAKTSRPCPAKSTLNVSASKSEMFQWKIATCTAADKKIWQDAKSVEHAKVIIWRFQAQIDWKCVPFRRLCNHPPLEECFVFPIFPFWQSLTLDWVKDLTGQAPVPHLAAPITLDITPNAISSGWRC